MFTLISPHESINSNCVFPGFWKFTVEVIEDPIQTDLKLKEGYYCILQKIQEIGGCGVGYGSVLVMLLVFHYFTSTHLSILRLLLVPHLGCKNS